MFPFCVHLGLNSFDLIFDLKSVEVLCGGVSRINVIVAEVLVFFYFMEMLILKENFRS